LISGVFWFRRSISSIKKEYLVMISHLANYNGKTWTFGTKEYSITSLRQVAEDIRDFNYRPRSIRILTENVLRHAKDKALQSDVNAILEWKANDPIRVDVPFTPERVVMQDFTGVPAIVDLAAMREAIIALNGKPDLVNPLQPVELVIDHSVQVDVFGRDDALSLNEAFEYQRNTERYAFLRWGQRSFKNFSVVPPATGIVHQVNLEYLARVVMEKNNTTPTTVCFDTVVGTDSHTTMINGLGVLGWGVGGIEAEAAMLGQPMSMLLPDVVGVRLSGRLPAGATATDLVLTITQLLRRHGVVGKFVEFFGPALSTLPLADRATIANMAPEYGATCGFFPIDSETMRYLELTGRPAEHRLLVEAYAREQGLFAEDGDHDLEFSTTIDFKLDDVEPCMAGPSRPQDRVVLVDVPASFQTALQKLKPQAQPNLAVDNDKLSDGSVVIAAITSCTNTSNPQVMVAAGLLAQNAVKRGLQRRSWVKTSLAPGSRVVSEYLQRAGLLPAFEALGFHIVGYGCTTCIGNSGPLPDEVAAAVKRDKLVVASVLSGNRNFEGRVQSDVKTNYLASPPLVVAYALAGRVTIDWESEAIGLDPQGQPVFLRDIWPSPEDVQQTISEALGPEQFSKHYANVFDGDNNWQQLTIPEGDIYTWDQKSTYVRKPPYFEDMSPTSTNPQTIENAYVLALLGDSITTDHISPAGAIKPDSPAGRWLLERDVSVQDFNSYGSRRGNHEIMMRGTFANVRLRNQLAPDTEGGFTKHIPSDKVMTIFDAAELYRQEKHPLIIIAGKEYGSGSSRDWAAKGPMLLGVRAAIAESFERIHRSNLVGMGILPLEFLVGQNAQSLNITGTEQFSFIGLIEILSKFQPNQQLKVVAQKQNTSITFKVRLRIDTPVELNYYLNGGILQYVLRQLSSSN
jgi:aconitate hydratase